jgi:type I restriction enzyme S subunit
MRQELPKYPKYKPSGVVWIEEIPEGWQVHPIKRLLSSIIDTEHKTAPFEPDGEYLVARTSNVRDGRLHLENAKYTSEDGYREWTVRGRPRPGDILFTREAPAGEACIVPNAPPLCLGQRVVLFRTNRNKADSGFLVYSICEGLARRFIDIKSQGSTVPHFNMSDIGIIPILAPPDLSNQRAIVAFLDVETGKIDRLMGVRRRQIEVLREQRAAVIHHAVTQGLDPTAPMKDSGVEWLGMIPAHWEVRRLKFLAHIKNGQDFKKVEAETGYPVIGSGGQFAYATDYLFKGESVLFGRKGTIDRPLYVNGAFWTVDTMFYCRITNEISPRYLYFCALGFPFGYYSTQTALPSMTQQDLSNHTSAVPPMTEQLMIVAHIDRETAKIDALIAKYERELALLEEYRASLISHAVTGKIDVRGWVETNEAKEGATA